jgi:enoyl-CoA hydratase/carnithine racemase
MSDLKRALEGPVLTLTLDRESQRNALSVSLVDDLLGALAEAARDPQVRVVVLTGAGARAFCAGGDLGGGPGGDGFLEAHEGRRRYAALLSSLASFEKPTIARVNGLALAGGLGLVCACDLALATDDAQFGTPEVNVGLFPYMVTALLFRALAPKHAMELVLTGRRIDAAEALRIGLVNRALPRAELDAAVAGLAAELASKSPAVLRLGKRALASTRDLATGPALELLAAQLSVNSLAEDALEGIAAFLEKRPPDWKGR